MARNNYSQRYPQRAKIQYGIAAISLLMLALSVMPPVTVTIGGSPVSATTYRGSAR